MTYPVTTPFGQVPGYPLNNGFHNGIDYGYPMGTPVVVNGVTIGLSNNTGASTGPHLHVGKYVGGQVQDPGVGNGFQFNSAVVYDTGSDSTNGNYVRVTGDGALWNYLHLEKILVSKGQILKGVNMSANPTAQQAHDTVMAFETEADGITPHQPTQADLDFGVSTPWESYIPNFYPMVQVLRQKIKLLSDERDNTLYPFVNAVCADLKIPITTDFSKIAAAITALQKAGTPLNATNVQAYIKEHLN